MSKKIKNIILIIFVGIVRYMANKMLANFFFFLILLLINTKKNRAFEENFSFLDTLSFHFLDYNAFYELEAKPTI